MADINKVTRDETLSDAIYRDGFTRFLCLHQERSISYHLTQGIVALHVLLHLEA